jgi:hypothetical protein
MTAERLQSFSVWRWIRAIDEVIEVMPELLRRFPNSKYMVVGDGEARGKVKSLDLSEQIIFASKIPEH